jgi:hemoglobin
VLVPILLGLGAGAAPRAARASRALAPRLALATRALALVAMGAILVACPGGGGGNGAGGAGGSPADEGLFARLGGMDGVRALVDDLAGRVAADERIQRFFVKTDFRRFKARLVVQLCALSGGPCRYTGRSMAEVHGGRRIRGTHFEAFMEDIAASLTAIRLSARDRVEFLKRVRALKPDIVR